MFRILMATWFGSLILVINFPVSGQVPAPKPSAGQTAEPGLQKLSGGDEKREKELDEQIETALKADRWDEAIAKADELLALRTRVQGPKHFETVDAEWRLKTFRRLAAMPREDHVAYMSGIAMTGQAHRFSARGTTRRPSRCWRNRWRSTAAC